MPTQTQSECGSKTGSNGVSSIDAYLTIETAHGQALIRQDATDHLSQIDGIIFDMDGVLLDVSESIQRVHGRTAGLFFQSLGWTDCAELVTPEDVDAFKLAGGFNSDWDLAYVWQLLYLLKGERYREVSGGALRAAHPTIEEFTEAIRAQCGGFDTAVGILHAEANEHEWAAIVPRWDRERLLRLFTESYSGNLCQEVYGFKPETVTGPGLIRFDRPMFDRRALPSGLRYGIATGRTRGEAAVAIRLMGWTDLFPPDVTITEDDGFKKPDPQILALTIERMGIERPLYIGDTPDDMLTAERYREAYGDLITCIVMTGHSNPELRERFIARKVDIIADNVNAALIAVNRCIGGAIWPDEQPL